MGKCYSAPEIMTIPAPHLSAEGWIAQTIINAFLKGKKLLIIGNGGSAAEAQHMAAELVGRFEHERRALPAIALTTDTSILTAWSNDYSFVDVFRRQVEALGNPGDVLLCISTSGKSQNVLDAADYAKRRGLVVLHLPRGGSTTAYIQESQLVSIHDICREIERAFLDESYSQSPN